MLPCYGVFLLIIFALIARMLNEIHLNLFLIFVTEKRLTDALIKRFFKMRYQPRGKIERKICN